MLQNFNRPTVVTIVVGVVLLSVFEFSEYRGVRPSNLLLKTIAMLQSDQPVDDRSQTKCCQPVDDEEVFFAISQGLCC
jgi:hypothetical protein